MDQPKQKEVAVYPNYDIVVIVSGEPRELICQEIPAYWYTWLELQKRAA